jgi:hypothetical protein
VVLLALILVVLLAPILAVPLALILVVPLALILDPIPLVCLEVVLQVDHLVLQWEDPHKDILVAILALILVMEDHPVLIKVHLALVVLQMVLKTLVQVILVPRQTEQWDIHQEDPHLVQDPKCQPEAHLVDLQDLLHPINLPQLIFKSCRTPSMLWRSEA